MPCFCKALGISKHSTGKIESSRHPPRCVLGIYDANSRCARIVTRLTSPASCKAYTGEPFNKRPCFQTHQPVRLRGLAADRLAIKTHEYTQPLPHARHSAQRFH